MFTYLFFFIFVADTITGVPIFLLSAHLRPAPALSFLWPSPTLVCVYELYQLDNSGGGWLISNLFLIFFAALIY